ncbi:interferon-induced protein 44-like isoform X4 [Silurus meridionalis]|nr:interferon-induced protein 44-like isoform X4 [Silurus meridionalis]
MKLCCVKDKHIILKNATKFSLEIVNAQEADGGKYTINLKNHKGEISCSSYVRVEIKEWRNFNSNQKQLLNNLKEFKIFHKIPKLRFLLYGPVGGGKSSTINTIRTIFEGRQLVECLAAALSETSHTKRFDSFEISEKHGSFPFIFYDTMGVQAQDGVHINDIIAALKGHMKVGYMCEPKTPLSEDSIYYLKYPSLSDRMHCLLCIIPADKIGLMGKDFLDQFKMVCKATQAIRVPQVVLMTRVECVCIMTRNNLRNVYKSQKIRDKMTECSNKLGVPVNRIFPVKNYHEETDVNEDINCLMLDALNNVVRWANDYVTMC